jgi:hypothetical protein
MPENGRISDTSQVDLFLREKEARDSSTTQGKTVMRMMPEEFHPWSQHLQITSETEALTGFTLSILLMDLRGRSKASTA